MEGRVTERSFAKVARAVIAAGFYDWPRTFPRRASAAGGLLTITVERGHRRSTVQLGEREVPAGFGRIMQAPARAVQPLGWRLGTQ